MLQGGRFFGVVLCSIHGQHPTFLRERRWDWSEVVAIHLTGKKWTVEGSWEWCLRVLFRVPAPAFGQAANASHGVNKIVWKGYPFHRQGFIVTLWLVNFRNDAEIRPSVLALMAASSRRKRRLLAAFFFGRIPTY